jgi:hypothetical protein
MVRWLSFSVVVVAVLASSCTAEQQICGRMETLCGTKREDCSQLVKSTKESMGDDGVQGLKTCFADATSCGEATGCVTAKGLKGLGNAMGDFFKGMVKGLEDKK